MYWYYCIVISNSQSQQNEEGTQLHDVNTEWAHTHALLFGKTESYKNHVEEFRPITILDMLFKTYSTMIYILCMPYLAITGCIQFGARAGHSAIELIFLIRIILEKAIE